MAIKTVCKQNQYVSYFSVAAKEANHFGCGDFNNGIVLKDFK
jgi:hypothetical protein